MVTDEYGKSETFRFLLLWLGELDGSVDRAFQTTGQRFLEFVMDSFAPFFLIRLYLDQYLSCTSDDCVMPSAYLIPTCLPSPSQR